MTDDPLASMHFAPSSCVGSIRPPRTALGAGEYRSSTVRALARLAADPVALCAFV
jgi:hypothetical protein